MNLPSVCGNGTSEMICIKKYEQQFLLFVVCVFLFSELSASEIIDGNITAVGNGQIVVDILSPSAGQAYPAKGDKVTFWVEIIGLDQRVDAGGGVVSSVDGKTVTVKGSGKPPPLEASAQIAATGTFNTSIREPDFSAPDDGASVSPAQSQTTQAVLPPEPQQIPLDELDEVALRRKAESSDSEAMYLLGKKLDVLFGHVNGGWKFDRTKRPQREALEWYKKSLAIKQTKHVEEAYQALESRKFSVGRVEMIAPPGFLVTRVEGWTILEFKKNYHASWTGEVRITFGQIKAKKLADNAEKYLDKVSKKAHKNYEKVSKHLGKDVSITSLGTPLSFRNGEFLVTGINSFDYMSMKPRDPLLHIIYLDLRSSDIYHFISVSQGESYYGGGYWSDYVKASMVIYDW